MSYLLEVFPSMCLAMGAASATRCCRQPLGMTCSSRQVTFSHLNVLSPCHSPCATKCFVPCGRWAAQSDQAIKKYTRVERGNFEVAVTSPPSPSRRMSNINIDIEHQRYRPHVVIRSIQARPREDALDSVLED